MSSFMPFSPVSDDLPQAGQNSEAKGPQAALLKLCESEALPTKFQMESMRKTALPSRYNLVGIP